MPANRSRLVDSAADSAHESPPLRARLRMMTAELHDTLEARLDLLSPELSHERYRLPLVGFHGYYASIEPRLVVLARSSRLPLPIITRTRLLERDLSALGLSAEAIAEIPRCDDVPSLREREDLAGCLYVLEGARLGGKVIAHSVEHHLGLSSERGCSFFAGDGEQPQGRWAEVLFWLERLATEPEVDQRKIVASAVET